MAVGLQAVEEEEEEAAGGEARGTGWRARDDVSRRPTPLLLASLGSAGDGEAVGPESWEARAATLVWEDSEEAVRRNVRALEPSPRISQAGHQGLPQLSSPADTSGKTVHSNAWVTI